MATRSCNTCSAEKPIEEFDRHLSRGRAYRDHTCRPCRRAKQREVPRPHRPNQVSLRRRFHLQTLYGLTPEAFEALVERQGGRCANPGCAVQFDREHPRLPTSIYIDHDHATGKVRGLLCMDCNLGLGRLHDSPDRIRGLLSYLGVER